MKVFFAVALFERLELGLKCFVCRFDRGQFLFGFIEGFLFVGQLFLEALALAVVRLSLGGLCLFQRAGKCLVGFLGFGPGLGQVGLGLFGFRLRLGQAGVGVL